MKLHQLSGKDTSKSKVILPISDQELIDRHEDYPILNKAQFSKKYNYILYNSVELSIDNLRYEIQVNFCANPFCRWYGQEQYKYLDIKNKPSRYTLHGSEYGKSLKCNDIVDALYAKPVLQHFTTPLSNWSIAEEIKRLYDINTVVPIEPDYVYHKDDCEFLDSTPKDNPANFYKRGKSTSNSQKFQCKKCNKHTNVLPTQAECFTYKQRLNHKLPLFAKLILSRTPVTRICDLLDIGVGTYYHKLEWLYRRCLEFLDRHETNKLASIHFDELWLNTDKFTYHLNNVRKKGHGKEFLGDREKPIFPTSIVATTDSKSRYIFRADVAFDYNADVDEVIDDIHKFKEDKLYWHLQKNSRFRYIQMPDETVDNDSYIGDDFIKNLYSRKSYVDGLHTNSTYTSYAHYWLLNNLLNVDNLYVVTDEDNATLTTLLRVYKDKVMNKKAHIFTCRVDKSLSKTEAYQQYKIHREEIGEWQEVNDLKCGINKSAEDLLAHKISVANVFRKEVRGGKVYTIGVNEAIEHPYPYKDEGNRYINCVTDLSSLTPCELAEIMYKVDLRSINTFFNQLRRKISILERPLSGGRNEGKSYIYSNFNPKYAQYMVTIARTFLNFCETYKCKGEEITPAMSLGIASKVYSIEDILYLK